LRWQPKTIAADQRAFAAARQHAIADAIITGARAWREAFSPPHSKPRYLPVLVDWLDQRAWEKPPPETKRRSKSKHNGNGQYRNGHYRGNGKFDGAGFALRYVGLIKDEGDETDLGGAE
jgi:hypothetical protein